jgi:hypothetical protein
VREQDRAGDVDPGQADWGLDTRSQIVIRPYQAAHGGMVFHETPTKRQKSLRTRMTAIAVIAAVAGSAALVQQFATAHADPVTMGFGSQR